MSKKGKLDKVIIKRLLGIKQQEPSIGWHRLMRLGGVSRAQAERFLYRYKKGYYTNGIIERNLPVTKQQIKDNTYNQSKTNASASAVTSKPLSEQEVSELYSINTDKWEADTCKTSVYPIQRAGGVVETQYVTKITYKLKKNYIDYKALLNSFGKSAREFSPKKYTMPSFNTKQSEHMLEINLRDLHIGKLATKAEVGEDYNLDIAYKRAVDAMHDIIEKALPFGFEQILLVTNDDMCHVDSNNYTTTSGTPQDSCCTYYSMIDMARQLLVDVVDYLRGFAPVKVVMVSGNHDTNTGLCLAQTIHAWYRNCEDVEIDKSPSNYKYHLYGTNLLGFTHGNLAKAKINTLGEIMSVQVPELWAKSKTRCYHLGHFHSTAGSRMQFNSQQIGCTVQFIGSLTGTDSWHHKSGYIQNSHSTNNFLWSKDSGLICQFDTNIIL